MYFFVFIVLIFVLIPSLEIKYKSFLYFKMFITSIIYFFFLNSISRSLLVLLLTLITFMVLILLIYRTLKSSIDEDSIIYNLAHEVKNPLTICKGYIDMIDLNNKEKANKYLLIIKDEINRSLMIMNDFLDTKKLSLNKDIMDITLLVDDIKETMSYTNINLNVSNLDKEIIIDGDYDKLKQVLINLIKNSYEAEATEIKLILSIHDKYLKLDVVDNGKGITKFDLKKMGELFYTTKATGTGIGVNISKEIIRLHEGSLSYESEVNKGTKATIILPIKYIF